MKCLQMIIIFIMAGSYCHAQNIVYDKNAEVRTVSGFSGVEVSGTVSLYLSQGPTQGVAVSAEDAKYNSKITTEVKNGILHISVDGGFWNGFNWTNRKLKAYVTVSDLSRIEASGASYVSLAGSLKSNDLKIDVSGASEIKGDINIGNLAIDISGASVARLSGTARNTKIDASGACTVNSYSLQTDSCKAFSSGASVIRIFVKDYLTADANGGSSISYKGDPLSTNINNSMGSSIKHKISDN